MKESREVICLGMAVVDILIHGVDFEKGIKEDTKASAVIQAAGGDAFNQAVILSRLGHRPVLYSLLGRDTFGAVVRELGIKEGVDMSGVHISQRCPTSVSIVCVQPGGERYFITHDQGSVNEYSMEDIDLDAITGAKVLSVGSLGGSSHLRGDEFACIFRRAKEEGMLIVADMVTNLGKDTALILKNAFPYIDYLVPSMEEAVCFSGTSEVSEAARFFRDLGVKNVIIKMGQEGAYVSAGNEACTVPAFRTRTVDTTGAGDNFMAGFVAGLLEERDVMDCVRMAAAAGAVSVSAAGAQAGVKSREQLGKFLESQGIML